MDIEDWRNKIDELDLQILQLLNQRAQFTVKIAQIKHSRKLPIYSPEREQAIINRLVEINCGPLTKEGVRRVFEMIIDESRKLENDSINNQAKEEY